MTPPPAHRQSPFDGAVAAYDRARPSYPPALWDDVFAHLPPRPAVVEIGPGTGKATASLLARGAHVTAVEPGPNLAAFLAQKFGGSPRLKVINARFEDAPLSAQSHDLVLAATSFHWVDEGTRVQQAHDLLRPGGYLAILGMNQVRSRVDRGFFARCFPIYQKHRPGEPRTPTPGRQVVPPEFGELQASGSFQWVKLFRYPWDQTYPTAVYADLVRSYSNSQEMQPAAMEALIADLSALIDSEFGGQVTRPLVATLTLARRA